MSKKIFKYHDVIFLLYHPHLVYRYLWLEWTLMKMILAKTNTKKNIFGHILFVDMYYDLAYGTRGGLEHPNLECLAHNSTSWNIKALVRGGHLHIAAFCYVIISQKWNARNVMWRHPRNKMCKSQPKISSISVMGINQTLKKKAGFLSGPNKKALF